MKVQILNPDAYLRPDMNSTVKFLADEAKHTSRTAARRLRSHRREFAITMARSLYSWLSMARPLEREVKIISQRSGGVLVQGLNGGEDVITAAPPT